MLNIITPTSRPNNLHRINKNLLELPIPIKWWVVFDSKVKETPLLWGGNQLIVQTIHSNQSALAGHAHRNTVLNILDKGWVMSLDDDNIIPLEFSNIWPELEGCKGIIFDQMNKDGSIRLHAGPDKVKLNHIDTAQFMFRREIVGDLRFDENRYDADGVFIETLYNRNKKDFKFINKPYSYYNYLT